MGGNLNTLHSFIGTGVNNRIYQSSYCTVLNGYYNVANGQYATILGGNDMYAYNRACVRVDEASQTTLLNLLLRNHLKHNHIDAAYNLI